MEFSLKAFRPEIKFHTNPGLPLPSFEQPGTGFFLLLFASCEHGINQRGRYLSICNLKLTDLKLIK